MECVSWLLAIAVVWLIVREVRARDRIARLEAAQESQHKLIVALTEALDGLKQAARS